MKSVPLRCGMGGIGEQVATVPGVCPLAARAGAVQVPSWRLLTTVIRRILLVEDEPGVRQAIRTLLERAGFSVAVATDGAEAWELLSRGPRPVAILVDLYTPRMSGHDLVARVRRTPRLALVPIIAMSGGSHASGTRPSAEAFLEKPFSPEQLELALRRVGAADEP